VSKRTWLQVLAGLLVITGLGGCQPPSAPDEVARAFWVAVQARDAAAVEALSDAPTTGRADTLLPVDGVRLGRTVIDGDRAEVETSIRLGGDDPMTVPLTTYLIRRDGAWKVDYADTVAAIRESGRLGGVLGQLRDFSRQFSGEVDRSLDELEQALPRIEREVRGIEELFRSQVPELRERIEEFARALDRALKRPPADRPREPPPRQAPEGDRPIRI